MRRFLTRAIAPAVLAALAALAASSAGAKAAQAESKPKPTVVEYDSRTLAEYESKWVTPYGPLEMASADTRAVSASGVFSVSAVPFTIGADFSVFDHLKYLAISQPFAVPESGSLTFAVDIRAETPGATPGRVIHGCYLPDPYAFWDGEAPCADPWSAPALQGQQAGVVLNMINFETGQLFDWFVSGDTAFTLVERLPSNVTNPSLPSTDPTYVGMDEAYTQIIDEVAIKPGKKVTVQIRYTRGPGTSRVEYFLDKRLISTVEDVGVPLDVQGVPFTGIYPSYGPGEPLAASLDSFVIGHGLFSLLDEFPFQHPERPDLRVSVPMSERLFGQGAAGEFSDFRVTTAQD